jgi:hypothetical protein
MLHLDISNANIPGKSYGMIHCGRPLARKKSWLYTLFIEPKIAIQPFFAEPELAIHLLVASL